MASQPHQLHFILIPLMAPGHMIPMIDIAKLLAQRGVIVTIVTTPVNSARFKPVITRAIETGLPIQLHELQFPCAEAGLPEGCENFDMLPSLDMGKNVMVAASMLKQPLEQLLEEIQPQPSCMISDMGLPYTADVARKFHIPRIIFYGICCFTLSCSHNIRVSKVLEKVTSDSEYFVVPGLPDRVEFTKAQLSSFNPNSSSDGNDFLKKFIEAEKTAYGVVVNTFEELEPEYIKEYKKVKGDGVWCVGPVSLCNKDYLDKAERGNKASIDENQCFKWLDLWEPSSVIYACLGSLCNLITSQVMELGLGLEASNRPFIWVIKGEKSKEMEKLILEDGFEERTKERGLVIMGWAPQVLILSHPAIGGFITHCGWNSTLEGVCASVPMITWPLFADQFYDEKLVVQLLRIGVRIGVEVSMQWGKEEEIGVLVKKEDVVKAIDKLMDKGEEGKERRTRARELGEKAKRAIDEGGSSHRNMTLLIHGIMQQAHQEEST